MTRNAPARSAVATKDGGLRRAEPGAKCACAHRTAGLAGACSDCARSRFVGVHAALALGPAGDRYEREADGVADRIARGGRPARPRAGYLTRLSPHAVRGIEVPAETMDAALAEPGAPLDSSTRVFHERRLAHDFSNVRVHAGATAAAAAKALGARAFTLGRHVFFADGQLRPDAPHGRRLLAHELAHVVQQSALHVSDANRAARAPVQRQSWLETLQSGAASLVPESVWSALDVDPAAVAAMAPNPADAIALLKRLRDAPVLGPMLMRALPTSEGVETLLGLDDGTLDRVFAVLADPEPHLESLRAELQPIVEQVPAYAAAEAEARLGWLRDRGEPFARVTDAMGGQLAQLPGQWWPIAVEILRSQFALWDWSVESAALEDAAAKRAAGEFDDDCEYWLHVAQTLSDGLDRILGAVGVAAFVVGLVGGGTAGGAAGGTGAGLVGGAVTLGTGAAPSAALGGAGGGGAGGGIGGGLGGLVYELLGGVSLVGAVGTEVALLGDAVKDLSLEEQSAAREQADYEQVAASLIGLAMMAAFAVLGSVGARIAKKTKGALLGAARKAAARIDAPAVPDAAVRAAAPVAAVDVPATIAPVVRSRDVAPQDVDAAARASDAELDASVAHSLRVENERLAPEQIAKEVAHVERHPELVEGEPPHRRAALGAHEIVEKAGGGCARHSAPPELLLPCPVTWSTPAPVDLSARQTVDLTPPALHIPRNPRYGTSALRRADAEAPWRREAERLIDEAMRASVAIKHPLRGAGAPGANRYSVYLFLDEHGDLMKVGQTLDLAARIESNLKGELSPERLDELRALRGSGGPGLGRPAEVRLVGRELNETQAGALERAIQRDLDVPGIAPQVPADALGWASGLVGELRAAGFFAGAPLAPPGERTIRGRARALFANVGQPSPLVERAVLAPDAPAAGAYSVYAFFDAAGRMLKVGITEQDRIVERTIENLSDVSTPSSKRVSAPFHGLVAQEGVVPRGVRMQIIAHHVNAVQALALERAIGTDFVGAGRYANLADAAAWAQTLVERLVRRDALRRPQ